MIENKSPQWGFLELILVYLGIMMSSFVYAIWMDDIDGFLALLGVPAGDFSFFVGAFLFQFVFTVALVYFFTVITNRASARDIGFRVPPAAEFLRYGVVGGILLIAAVFLLSIPISFIKPDLQPQIYEEILRSLTDPSSIVWLTVIGVILAPFSEEMFYRGMMYPVFRRFLKPQWAMAVSGIVFGLAHFDLWRAIPLAVGGAGLCYIYEKTGSILVTSVAHGVWNLIMTLMVIYSLSFMP